MARWAIFFSNLDLVGGGIALEIGFDLPAFDFFCDFDFLAFLFVTCCLLRALLAVSFAFASFPFTLYILHGIKLYLWRVRRLAPRRPLRVLISRFFLCN